MIKLLTAAHTALCVVQHLSCQINRAVMLCLHLVYICMPPTLAWPLVDLIYLYLLSVSMDSRIKAL